MNPRIVLAIFGIGALVLGLSMFFVPILVLVAGWPSWVVPTVVTVAGALALIGAWRA